MSRQITKMWEVQHGKRYFLLQNEHGTIRTAIVKAEVTYKEKRSGLIDRADILFILESGDASPGPTNADYVAELDD